MVKSGAVETDRGAEVPAVANPNRMQHPGGERSDPEPAVGCPRRESPITRRYHLLLPLFAASGCSSLVFEILWQRKMMLVFGASATAITAILTAFFCGIALGSVLGGRLLQRASGQRAALRFYAIAEAWIGTWALAVPYLLQVSDILSQRLLGGTDAVGMSSLTARFALAVFVVLPATTGMGATIPVMTRLLHVSKAGMGRAVGIAYGVNAGGAVAGCLLCGFVLPQAFGIDGALMAAVSLNALVVAGTLAIQARVTAEHAGPATPAKLALSGRGLGLVAVYFAASAAAIGLEVVWFRALAIFNTNSLVTFTTGLATYIGGFSVGSLILYPLLQRRVGSRLLAVSCLGVGFVTSTTLFWAQSISNWVAGAVVTVAGDVGTSFVASTMQETVNAAMLMLLPTLFMGLAFPAVCDAIADSRTDAGDASGKVYFLGNLGAAVGALGTGLVLVPSVGIRASGFGLAVLNLALATVCGLLMQPRNFKSAFLWLGAAGAIVTVCVAPAVAPYVRNAELQWDDGFWRHAGRPLTILRYKPGASGTVTVKRSAKGERSLYVDDQDVASTFLYAKIDAKMLAHIPLLMHPNPARALNVGFGSGGTSYSMVQHGVRTDVVEIEPEVVEAAPLFERQNHGVLDSPLLRVVLNDARNFLHTTSESYDVISTDVTNLQYRQSSSLYTLEYFELMKRRLEEGGIACAWIPLRGITYDELRILMRTFEEVFPHAFFWFMDHSWAPFAILTGTEQPAVLDYDRLVGAFGIEAVRKDLERIGVVRPAQLIQFIYLNAGGYRRFTGEGPLHTDDRPVLEFEAHVSFHGRRASVRERMLAIQGLKPDDPYSLIRGVPRHEREQFDRQLEFARVWGEFTLRRLLREEGLSRPGSLESDHALLQRTLELVPDYAFALAAQRLLLSPAPSLPPDR